ncbi:hypothetical protein PENSPDRAFT_682399 [Peniophora sp. CONT]|nr:hypothetical protein PENSPDRAFT_682399 [Peniophora sp. CONT]
MEFSSSDELQQQSSTQASREDLRTQHQINREEAQRFLQRPDLPGTLDLSEMRDALQCMQPSRLPTTEEEEEAMRHDIDRLRRALWNILGALIT